MDEPIISSFYEEELQKVPEKLLNKSFEVEKVLKTRKYKNKQQQFVKWRGYPDKFNSWVNKDK